MNKLQIPSVSRLKPYSKYVPAGVEWLSDIPADWRVTRVKLVFREIDERSEFGEETLLSVSEYFGVKPRQEVIEENELLTRAETLEGYRRVRRGDLVMNIMLAWKTGLGFAPVNGIVSPAYSVFRLIDPADDPWYFHYLLRSRALVSEMRRWSYGIIDSRLRLYPEVFMRLRLIKPPQTEQRAIASFLDRRTSKIDSLIAKKERLIEFLQEKRTALITRAVTKGLDSNVPMKDSGEEWLGEIPEHWGVKPLKRVSSLRAGTAITSDSIEDVGDFPVYGGNGIRGFTSSYTHDGEFPLIGRQGALCGCINFASGRFWASEHAVVASPGKDVSPRWLGYVLQAMSLNSYSESAAQPGLAVETISGLQIPTPQVSEQKRIAHSLDRETKKTDALVAKIRAGIDRLKEYRTALISAAVTGKIDVREEAA